MGDALRNAVRDAQRDIATDSILLRQVLKILIFATGFLYEDDTVHGPCIPWLVPSPVKWKVILTHLNIEYNPQY